MISHTSGPQNLCACVYRYVYDAYDADMCHVVEKIGLHMPVEDTNGSYALASVFVWIFI